ncbi:MAG TPA: prolyl oligopeptidase family serine peptidase [Candidatus Babeliales bacterium]|nr:prolyl oligopeptidase family serine peptidase [Candidatus Babeliales bacterium]
MRFHLLLFTFLFALNAHAETVFIYAHGLGGSQEQARKLYMRFRDEQTENKHWIIDGNVALFDFADVLPQPNMYRRELVNLGQQADLERLHFAYQETLKRVPDAEIVLVGLSRGAATIINYVGLYKPAQLKAIVLDSPFDSFESIINQVKKIYFLQWIPQTVARSMMRMRFPSLEIDGITPSKTIHWLPITIPTIFIHSQTDLVVPIDSSRFLFEILKNRGHKDLYLLQLPDGDHGMLMRSAHAADYEAVVHAFFARYNIVCNDKIAQLGTHRLNQCRATI